MAATSTDADIAASKRASLPDAMSEPEPPLGRNSEWANVTLDLGYRFRVLHEAPVEYRGEPLEPGETALDTGTNHIIQAGLSFGF